MGHLLLVDNDPDILELLEMGLTGEGYEVRTATSGVEALRSIEEAIPDVLVTDLIMPNIGGEKLLKIVNSVPEWRTIRTIVISGVAIEAPDLRARTPCDIYIAKGPIASTLQYLKDSLRNFDRMSEMGKTSTIGADGIFSRHITRELLEFKEDVDQILDHISDGVCKIDRELTLVWVNRAFATLVGKPEEAILGRRIDRVITTDEMQSLLYLAERRDPDAPRAVEVSLEPGRIARATLLYSFEEDDGYAALLWLDVTERLLLEEQYENIVESANDLIWTTDLDGTLTYVSRAAARIVGVEPESLLGRPLWNASSMVEQDSFRNEVDGLLAAARNGTLDTLAVSEWQHHRTEGELRWVQTRTSALKDRAGRIIGLQGTLSDITEQRNLMDEKEALLHEVHHRVRDNLQLIGSLARLSRPEFLETRIAALSEVFDELYRERSFSDVDPRALVERVAHTALANLGKYAVDTDRFSITVPSLPMRRAVPVALLVNELVQDLGRAYPEFDSRLLHVSLAEVDDGFCLSLGVDDAGDAAEDGGAAAAVPLETDRIPYLLADQLGGSGEYRDTAAGRSYTIRFS